MKKRLTFSFPERANPPQFSLNHMLEKIEGIVLEIIKHNDKHNVVTLYTRSRGRMAFLVPVAKTKAGKMRAATLSLMAVVSADVNVRAGKELLTLRQPSPAYLWHGIYSSPVKSSLLFFLTEFCGKLLRQYPADEKMWSFLIASLEALDGMKDSHVANFHLAFLIRLLPLAGIEPPVRHWEPGDRFDMLTGEMVTDDRSTTPTSVMSRSFGQRANLLTRRNLLSEEDSRHIPLLLRMNFRNLRRFRLTRGERGRLLNHLLTYYSTHLPLPPDYKTLPVLHDLFS